MDLFYLKDQTGNVGEMVINTSHSEYMNNRDKREVHRQKLEEYPLKGTPGNLSDALVKPTKTKDSINNQTGQTTDGIIANINGELKKKEEQKSGDGGFKRFKMPISEQRKANSSVGLPQLNQLRGKNSTEGIFDPNDLDYLLWHNEPKEVATGVHFAQMLNFEGVGDTLRVAFSSIAEDDENKANTILNEYVMDYPVFRDPDNRVRMLSNANTKEGPKTGMVKLVSQATHATGLCEAIAGKGVGVEMSLLAGKNVTKMHTIKSKPVDMRQMALKAMMLKLQLTLLHSSEEGNIEVEAQTLKREVPVLKTSQALDLFPRYNVIVDVTKFSVEQQKLLLVLCSAWPSQKLINAGAQDVYSMVSLEEEDFSFYVTSGESFTLSTDGHLPTPRELWSQCVQLFMNMGGFDDLITVVRDNRGLAPILTHNAAIANNNINVVSAYPSSTCYHGLSVNASPERRYIAPTMLESSSLVLLVDNIMLSVYLNNMLYLAEELGLGSKILYPRPDARDNTKIGDVLYSHGLKGNSPQNSLMSKVCPWLARLDRFQNSGLHVMLDIVNSMRRGSDTGLIYCPLNYAVSTIQTVCTASLMREKMEIDLSKIMGFKSNVSKTWEVIRLLNWYKAASGSSLPCYGTSVFGAKLKGDEMRLLGDVVHKKGHFKVSRIMAITEYPPQSTESGTLQQTFFNNPGYMATEETKVQELYSVTYKPNSFSIRTISGEGDKNKFNETQKQNEETGNSQGRPVTNKNPPQPLPAPEKPQPPQLNQNDGKNDKPVGNPPQGLLTCVDIPNVAEKRVEYTPGDCGIDALVSLIPNIKKAEGLAKLNLREGDRCWLTADELGKIAHEYDTDLIVLKESGPPEYYASIGSVRDRKVVVKQDGNHFVPCVPTGGVSSKPTLLIQLDRLPGDNQGREAIRRRIIAGQASIGGNKTVVNSGPNRVLAPIRGEAGVNWRSDPGSISSDDTSLVTVGAQASRK